MEAEPHWFCRIIGVSKGQLYVESVLNLGFPEPIFWKPIGKREWDSTFVFHSIAVLERLLSILIPTETALL